MKKVIICPNCGAQHILSDVLLDCDCGFPNLSDIPVAFIDDKPSSNKAAESRSLNSDDAHPVSSNTCNTCGATYSTIDYPFCPYCPPPATDEQESPIIQLNWPWGSETMVETLTIGREPPALPQLAARLETQYPNVSRRHAELTWENNTLNVRDLESTNGTFVNDQRLTPLQWTPLKHGDHLRFASTLEVTIRIE